MTPSFDTSTTSYANAAALASSSCPSCGYHLPFPSNPSAEATEAQRRILDLEAQVKLLNSKAAAAVDKLADYEDEIQSLRKAHTRSQPHTQVTVLSGQPLEGPGPAVVPTGHGLHAQSRLASLSALLPGRRKESNPSNPPVTPTFPPNNAAYSNNTLSPPKTPFSSLGRSAPTLQSTQSDSRLVTMSSLQTSLEEERTLRIRAESDLSQAQTELEDLTAQLFGQANEMVATERKARAKLEERVRVLEQRDVEKRKRLDRLEKAVKRIERVRAMVGD